DQTPAIGSKRRTNGELTLARGRSLEQQVCDVRACNQQHEPDGAEQHEKRGPYVSSELFLERHDSRRPTSVEVWKHLRELTSDAGHVVLRPRKRDAVPQ